MKSKETKMKTAGDPSALPCHAQERLRSQIPGVCPEEGMLKLRFDCYILFCNALGVYNVEEIT